jgi:hypothetical protein
VEVDGVLAGHHLILTGAGRALLLRHLRPPLRSPFTFAALEGGCCHRRQTLMTPARHSAAFIAPQARAWQASSHKHVSGPFTMNEAHISKYILLLAIVLGFFAQTR